MGVCRAFMDTAGGLILEGDPTLLIDGNPVAVVGNPVESHGNNEHDNAVMIGGNPSLVVNGVPVCTAVLSQSSCGHQPTGSAIFTIG